MPRLLSGDVVERHSRDGSYIPIRVLLLTEVCGCRHTLAPDNLLEKGSEPDLAPGAVARHAIMMRRKGEILYQRTTVRRSR